MESNSIPNFLTFTKDGWVDYGLEELAPPSSYEPLWWEIVPDFKARLEFYHRNWHYSLVICGVYIALTFGLQAIMKNRKPFGLKTELAVWNGVLGLFSILGVVRVLPDLWGKINRPNGLYRSLCMKDEISIPFAFWGQMFVISKIVELGDTLFLVLRKKPVVFLQWFHHAVSLTLAYNTCTYLEPMMRYYILMNYGVHSLMYPYFALRALNIHIPRQLANVITFLQLAQMMIGVGINVYTSYLYYFFGSCHRHPFSIKMVWFAYGSFLILFGQLFYSLVVKKSGKTGKSE